MKRKLKDLLKNMNTIRFLMDYYNAIDGRIFDTAIESGTPDLYESSEVEKFTRMVDDFQQKVDPLFKKFEAGRNTLPVEEKLLKQFIEVVTERARLAVGLGSAQDVAALVPEDMIFDGLQDQLKKYGGDKIAALLDIHERQRNFNDSLDNPPPKAPAKPAKPKPPRLR